MTVIIISYFNTQRTRFYNFKMNLGSEEEKKPGKNVMVCMFLKPKHQTINTNSFRSSHYRGKV